MNTNWPTKQLGNLFESVLKESYKSIFEKLRLGERIEEDDISCLVLDTLEDKLNETSHKIANKSIVIQTKRFTSKGSGSEESLTGADNAIILHVKYGNFDYSKFILIQAKRKRGNDFIFDDNAIKQARDMLRWTTDCYFSIYDKDRIIHVPAIQVSLKDKLSILSTKELYHFIKIF